jgi:predicted nuclease of predicted toxin-antitoxin system
VRVMLDENLSPELANRLNRYAKEHGCTFIPFPPQDYGIPDEEVPSICQRENAAALLTADRRDFAAKDVYRRGLVEAGVSVAVMKTYASEEFTLEAQLFRVLEYLPDFVDALRDTHAPLQISLDKSQMRRTTLQDVLEGSR